MLYSPQSELDIQRTGEAVSQILGEPLWPARAEFQDCGYSGSVYRFAARNRRGEQCQLLIKGVADPTAYHFYQDVLAPHQLDSPEVLGIFRGSQQWHLVMEYVPHQPPDWEDLHRYRLAVDWLARKDRLLQPHLEQLAELQYLDEFQIGSSEVRLAGIRQAHAERLDPLISSSFLRRLEAAPARWEQVARLLRSGPRTVTHNDFQMLNILFGAGSRQGELYVVDWTYPAIGTVCIDLATLIHVCPPRHRRAIIARYLAARPVPDFDRVFAAAQVHVHLSVLNWMLDAIRSGQAHAVHRPRLQEIVQQLGDYFAP